jgi:hypothetical protein
LREHRIPVAPVRDVAEVIDVQRHCRRETETGCDRR